MNCIASGKPIAVHGDPAEQRLSSEALRHYHRLFSERVQRWLDAGHGSCVLRRPEAREIMRTALHHFAGQRYTLGSFAIAGNHVHVLVAPVPGIDLSEVMHSWKTFSNAAGVCSAGQSRLARRTRMCPWRRV